MRGPGQVFSIRRAASKLERPGIPISMSTISGLYSRTFTSASEASLASATTSISRSSYLKRRTASDRRLPRGLAKLLTGTSRHTLAAHLGRRSRCRRTFARRFERFISKSELTDFTLRYVEIVKMLTSWMKYLRDSDWDNHG